MLSQGDKTNDTSLFSLTKEYLAYARGKNISSVYLGLVHRLDRVSSGVLVLAKRSKSAARLSEVLRERKNVQKHYVACVIGQAPASGVLEDLLYTPGGNEGQGQGGGGGGGGKGKGKFDSNKNKTRVVSPSFTPPNGDTTAIKFAQLEYTSLGTVDKHPKDIIETLLHVRPITGRKHQIRAQLSESKLPIVWDSKYGASTRSSKERGIALHALAMVIPHPAEMEGTPMVITAKIPEIWGTHFGERVFSVCNDLTARLEASATVTGAGPGTGKDSTNIISTGTV